MKNGKFCVSKKVLFLVFLMVVVGGVFYLINYANSQKIRSEPKAASKKVRCYTQQYEYSCPDINITPTSTTPAPTKTVKYYVGYVDNKKYFYRDQNCKQRIDEGIGNYCLGLSGSKTRCVVGYCQNSPTGITGTTSKRYYTDGTYYYLDSSCQGKISKFDDSASTVSPLNGTNIESDFCGKSWLELVPLQYNCPAKIGQGANRSSTYNTQVFYYQKVGNKDRYYRGVKKVENRYYGSIDITEFGVGNFCKIAAIQPTAISGSSTPTPLDANSRINKDTLVQIRCSDVFSLSSGAGNKLLAVSAGDLYNAASYENITTYYLGTSKASAFSDYSGAQSYCQAKTSAKEYVNNICLPRLCTKSGLIFYMKNGIIYSGSDCKDSSISTYKKICG